VKVLLTNTTLSHRTGTELYVVELAGALAERGHRPMVWSPVLGALAGELRRAAIPVTDDLGALPEAPDLVHGHHNVETLTALLHFPRVPGLFVCHGWLPWEESPPRFPRLLRYVAVDAPTRERVVQAGVPDDRIETILNFVDLRRFRPRPGLPERPRQALVLSNNAHDSNYLPAVREACSRGGIGHVEVAGIAAGSPASRPDRLLSRFELVFAKGRAALEAMAVGAAVVLCDTAGCGPLVSAAELDRLRELNFGLRTLREPVTVAALAARIARYDRADAARVSQIIRAEAGLEAAVDRYLDLYSRLLAEHRAGAAAGDGEGRAAADFLRWLNPLLKERNQALIDRDALWRRVHVLEAELTRRRKGQGAERPGPPDSIVDSIA
jgi:glycosyltransferase involved in cell wall biosynthesis